MPCSICKGMGHNMKTCKEIKSSSKGEGEGESEGEGISTSTGTCISTSTSTSKENTHYCYILQQMNKPQLCNYIGYTVNFKRRIRQHNNIIKGGARFTKNKSWEFILLMTCDTWNNIRGLQMEWLLKHPLRKKKRLPMHYGSTGAIRSLIEVIKHIAVDEIVRIYIKDTYLPIANTIVVPILPSNITIHDITVLLQNPKPIRIIQ
jgi:predicted GIY-YIG superfamily endonuclease